MMTVTDAYLTPEMQRVLDRYAIDARYRLLVVTLAIETAKEIAAVMPDSNAAMMVTLSGIVRAADLERQWLNVRMGRL